MAYVLLDIYWNRIFDGKEMDFNVRQLAAIQIDEELHTMSTFYRLDARYSKNAKQITYLMDISDEAIMDLESIWEEFKQWLPENVVFIVWDAELKNIIEKYNKIFRKKPIRAQFIDLQMLQETMIPFGTINKSIAGTMAFLELTCERAQMRSVLYCVQCMLRLYRKLWKEGRKFLEQQEWEDLLRSGNFSDLQQMEFFPELISKRWQAESRSMIKDFCMEKQYEMRVKGTRYEIDAGQAVWKFDLMNRGADLTYIPKRYMRIPHYDMQINNQDQSVVEVLPQIFTGISRTEERLKFGVGCTEVEDMLEKLCNIRYS